MTQIHLLLLPILLSSVLVFIVSSIIHMFSPWHKGDYTGLPDQDKILDALRPFDLKRGEYLLPRAASMEEMKSPEHKEKVKRGPVVLLNVFPKGGSSMGMSLVLWFVYLLVVGTFGAYVAGRALPVGAHYLSVFRFVGTVTFLTYAGGLWQNSIWYNKPWSTTIKSTVDGLIYGLLTAGMFGWLWP